MMSDELCEERGENYQNSTRLAMRSASELGMTYATVTCTGVGRLRCGAGGGGGGGGGDAR